MFCANTSFIFLEVYNLKPVHTSRNGNLLSGNPRRIIGSNKYRSFCDIFRLPPAAKRRIGNKHLFIITAFSNSGTGCTFSFCSAGQNRIDTNIFYTQFFR